MKMTTVIGLGKFGKQAIEKIQEAGLSDIERIHINSENIQNLNSVLESKDVFLVFGLSGSEASKYVPSILHLLKLNQIPIHLVAIEPFSFESEAYKERAKNLRCTIEQFTDDIKIISNDALMTNAQGGNSLLEIIQRPFSLICEYIKARIY